MADKTKNLGKGKIYMTRQEFIDDVTDFYDLKNFCYTMDLNTCEDVFTQEELDDDVNHDLEDEVINTGWQDILDWLYHIPTGYDFCRKDGRFDFVPLDDTDFEAYKDDVLAAVDDFGGWDDEPEEEDPAQYKGAHQFENPFCCEDEDSEITDVSDDEFFFLLTAASA